MNKYKYNLYENYAEILIINKKQQIFLIKIDLEDFDKVINFSYKWTASKHINANTYYVKATKYLGIYNGKPKYKSVLLHRYIIDAGDDEIIDHKNFDTLDNRKYNLRITTTSKNTKHRKTKNSNNTSGYRNVCCFNNQYIVQLQINGRNRVFGKFNNVEEAGALAKKMRQKYYGEFAGND